MGFGLSTSMHARCWRPLEITECFGSVFPQLISWIKEASHLAFSSSL
jgi:hypothetical protein